MDVSGPAATSLGIDLNTRPSAEGMAAEGLRYW